MKYKKNKNILFLHKQRRAVQAGFAKKALGKGYQ